MTENEVFEMILGIKEIQVDRIDWQESFHIHCSSIFEEALCPHCLKKRQVINQTYGFEEHDIQAFLNKHRNAPQQEAQP